MKQRYIDYEEPKIRAAIKRYTYGMMQPGDRDLLTDTFRYGNAVREVPFREWWDKKLREWFPRRGVR